MKQDQENFDSLIRLLALKRHEQPPPGYFDTLPGRIRASLKVPPRDTVFSSLVRLFSDRLKPALAYTFVLSVCAVMALAVNSFFHLEAHPEMAAQTTASVAAPVQAFEPVQGDHLSAALISGFATSSNPPPLFQIEPTAFHPEH